MAVLLVLSRILRRVIGWRGGADFSPDFSCRGFFKAPSADYKVSAATGPSVIQAGVDILGAVADLHSD